MLPAQRRRRAATQRHSAPRPALDRNTEDHRRLTAIERGEMALTMETMEAVSETVGGGRQPRPSADELAGVEDPGRVEGGLHGAQRGDADVTDFRDEVRRVV